MSNDLIKRLLDWSENDEGKINDARQEAAKLIGRLLQELSRVEHENQVSSDRIEQLEANYIEACDEAAECYMRQCIAERKLAEAAAPDDIREAIARAWCHEKNAAKEMDVDLAEAVLLEILALIGKQK